ncbi:MAG: EFR1 family ferrodoxin [Firmicutes bacterium]|nr:EFR1 family ferrodoxin [Bacillota bacterium]
MKKIVLFYFSGTGNTYYVAKKIMEYFRKSDICDLYSIEKHLADGSDLIESADIVGIGYPIYGSSLPKIVKDFISSLKTSNKIAFTFCTQLMFSGDGAAYGGRLLKKRGFVVKWQEHFNMPNNITDIRILTLRHKMNYQKIEKRISYKTRKFVQRILSERPYKKGSNFFSLLLGLSQRVAYEKMELNAYPNAIRIKEELCNGCTLCTLICPTNNLEMKDGIAVSKDYCTLCYRCINHCPKKAMYMILKKGVKHPYHGPFEDFKIKMVLKDDIQNQI